MVDKALQGAVERIILDADGELTGRIRLQKIAFFMREAGFLEDLPFTYYHYGPYSEDLAEMVKQLCEDGYVEEELRPTDWGTEYSVYRLSNSKEGQGGNDERERCFVQAAKSCSSVLLELAATALYLYKHEAFGKGDKGNAWLEAERRKKVKARDGRLRKAFEVYEKLRVMPTHRPLPEIPFPF